ncbi:1,2-phenylacetyl-CoA epoxidase subunit PaaD [Halosegnis marinus]|uniref:1,2-phenylacetyl-CoA epoxidase subunit PaaD n=1 Tax=Halosegnis marinus TaxID=3034023 RepID=A0ABD5ZQP8_9EURY|nr:1,2-phenylacetyl-CoA epoxidase subunit PaaD [Halosegnis sp. DT85]
MSEAPEAPFDGPEYCGYTDYVEGVAPDDLPNTGADATGLEREIWDAVYEIEDPEMPVSVVDLGLIYGVGVRETAEGTEATVRMTLTYTGCPARDMLTDDVREAAAGVAGVDDARVELVWSPEWNLSMVTDAGKESLRDFGVSI